MTSAEGGPGEVWRAKLSASDFQSKHFVWTEHSAAGNGDWSSITSSADGTRLAAAAERYGNILTSAGLGSTWTAKKLLAARRLLHPARTGLAWPPPSPTTAAKGSGAILTSADSGSTWTDQKAAGSRTWSSITSSADGTRSAAADFNGDILTSADSGSTWTDQKAAGSRKWKSITSSVDGTRLAAVDYNGDIWTSANSGSTWTDQKAAGSRTWSSITSSADCTSLAAASGGNCAGGIWTSADSGLTWTEQKTAGRGTGGLLHPAPTVPASLLPPPVASGLRRTQG